VIPAHNEERCIARLLAALSDGPGDPLTIIVIANGCSDRTAAVAEQFRPAVTVVEVADASKAHAIRTGDSLAVGWPRAYVDADVVIDRNSVSRMASVLTAHGLLACAPTRDIHLRKSSVLVRCYYRVWERLPQVRSGLFGRGVVMVSEEGGRRLEMLPSIMSDDLAMSEAFTSEESRVIEQASVIINPPRTVSDLVKRRVRVVTGNVQADERELRGQSSRTSVRTLASMVRQDPTLAIFLPSFLGVTAVARVRARRAVRSRDFTTWLRDESSRA
jgi:glycosyltransferase involved in cell wall biosynthesis